MMFCYKCMTVVIPVTIKDMSLCPLCEEELEIEVKSTTMLLREHVSRLEAMMVNKHGLIVELLEEIETLKAGCDKEWKAKGQEQDEIHQIKIDMLVDEIELLKGWMLGSGEFTKDCYGNMHPVR